MSYAAAIRDFLKRKNSSKGTLIIKPNGEWVHFLHGRALYLPTYATAETPTAEALLEAAQDLDQLQSK